MLPVPSIAATLNSDSQQSVYESLKRLAALGAASKILIDLGIGAVPFGIAADGLGQDARFTYDKDLGLLTVPSVATALAAYTTGPFVRLDGTSPLSADWDAGNHRIDSRNSTRWFNVVANGADSTGATDSTAAVQAAIIAGAGGTVYFPAGTYKILGTLTVGAKTTFLGDGHSHSTIKLPNNADGFSISVAAATQDAITFRDLCFLVNNGPATSGAFIRTTGAYEFVLNVSNCMFRDHLIGIQMNAGWFSTISGNQFASGNASGTDILVNNLIDQDHGDNLIFGNGFWSNGSYHIRQQAGGGTRILSNKFIGAAAYSVYLDIPNGKLTSILVISSNSFEGQVTTANVGLAAAGTYGKIQIRDNEFLVKPGATAISVAPTATGLMVDGIVTGNLVRDGAIGIDFNPGQAGGADTWYVSGNLLTRQTTAAIQLPSTAGNATNVKIGRNHFIQLGTAPYVSRTFSSSSGFDPAIETVFTQTADSTTTANSLTTMLGAGIGSLTIQAGRLKVGTRIRLRLAGYSSVTDGGSAAHILGLSLGGVTVATTTSASVIISATTPWYLDATITARTTGASGTVIGNYASMFLGALNAFGAASSTATVDTTGSLAVDIKYNNQNATGTITTTEATVEILD